MRNYLVQKASLPALVTLGFLFHLSLSRYLERGDFLFLLPSYILIFLAFIALGKLLKGDEGNIILKIFLVGLVFRIAWLFGFPQLSDDVYRFIWDGNLIHQGINPYAYVPLEILNERLIPIGENVENLYYQLNSPHYYSIYPPIKDEKVLS